MLEHEFWAIIHSTMYEQNQYKRLDLIKDELMKLSADQVASFDDLLTDLLCESDNCDLCRASRLIKGICSTDRVFPFCSWLVSKGQYVFERALEDPDSLADVLTQKDLNDGVEFEGLLYIAQEVYEEKTGKDFWGINDYQPQQVAGLNFEKGSNDFRGKNSEVTPYGWEFGAMYEMHKSYPNLTRLLLGVCL